MPSVILLIFVVQLLLNLISSIGAQAVNDIAWWFFTLLPSKQAKQDKENAKLKREVVKLKRELNAVSAQDDFAKWARLRRQHDKAKEKYEKESRDQQAFRSTFDSIVSKLRWLGTQGFNFFLNSWYAKQPMFWLPTGWVPYHAEWLLSFPRAPLGSISVNVWAIACGSVIGMVSEGIIALWTLQQGKVQTGANEGEKVKMAPISASTSEGSKKEL
ncbi:uncharacterized protein MYCFIDRAFT_134708 [Pseudocercospora fijiensis CIRAD86]|uniref:Uncharacterized protein n=1 Tax=Pseudocercospora fijiensis (strain CIRAD86) TaxID=383855 RepID=M3AH93_PSEFD|nr:uncharacterized protein MYCFIDRAFT_134708 [Pseudocercospora fijiensis CIRAD86]EME83946.1 hypothetical protein MYCFIDRAFT_134708 [Pseudocercospora fijiensis CIRAD86]